MALSLYNSLTQKKELLRTAEPGHVKMYICGPTVQDLAHLGHARCYTIYDVLVRHLRESGLRVTYVRNVTDVNDSIVERAKKLGEDPGALAKRMEDAWQEDMRRLGQISPDVEPHVTEHMPEIRALIAKLIERGHAYESDGDVYFRVQSFPGYGKLSRRKLEDMEMGGSGRTSEEETAKKEHPADFALWKKAPEGEQSWPSPWSQGRPGWHIECSAMGIKHLGEALDFHAGGLDLMFPHHENELAQSEAATGKQPWVRHWMHHGFIEVSKEKMSKSLGNFFTVRELFDRFEPESLRMFGLTVHYRSPLNLDWTLDEAGHITGFPQIEEAERRVEYIYNARERLASIPAERIDAADAKVPPGIAGFEKALAEGLDDDLNTPVALAATWEMIKDVNELAENATRRKKKVGAKSVDEAKQALARLGRVLGFGTDAPEAFLLRIRNRRAAKRGITDSDVEAKIAARNAARAAKDFAKADALRAELTALGVELMDNPTGTTWRIP